MSAVLSRRTYAIAALGVLAVALILGLIAGEVGGESGVLWVADLGEALLVAVSAAIILRVALSFGRGEGLRIQWLLIGLGALAFAIGDFAWTYFEAFRGLEPPYPGLPDVFYVLEYPLLAAGLIRAGSAYRGLVDVRKPFYIASVVGIVAVAGIYFGLLKPSVLAWDDVSAAEKAISSFYPIADVLFGLVPAIFLVLIVAKLGGGRFGWPWIAVIVGVILIAAADSAYSWLSAADAYESGMLIDYGWSLGHVALAVGASIALDIARPHKRNATARA